MSTTSIINKPSWLLAAFLAIQASIALAVTSTDEIYFNPALGIVFDQIEAYDAFDLQKMNRQGADYAVITTALVESHASLISRLLIGAIPSYTCESIDSQPTVVIADGQADITESTEVFLKKWKSLVDSDFVMAAMLADIELLKKAVQHKNNNLAQRNTSCTALALAAKTLACFQSLESNCHEDYFNERKMLEAFEIPDFDNEVKALLSDVKPFLAMAGEAQIQKLIESGKSYEEVVLSLTGALKRSLEDSVRHYQDWYSSEQIALLLAEQGDWLQDILGLSKAERQLIKQLVDRNAELDNAMLDYLNGQYSAANERLVEQQSIRALSIYYRENLNAYIALKDAVLSKITALKADGSVLLKDAVAAADEEKEALQTTLDTIRHAAPKLMTGNLNETFKIYVDLVPNGSLTDTGRPLNTARVFLFSTLRQQLISIPGCLTSEKCSQGDVNANPLIECDAKDRSTCTLLSEAGENIDLGVTVDNILQESDGSYSFYCPTGASCINSQRTISKKQMTHILEAMGVPPIVAITKNAKIFIDENLRNLRYEIDFNPFGELADAPPVSVTLIENGSVVEPKDIAMIIAEHVKTHVISKGLNEWLVNMPFIQKAEQQMDALFSLLAVGLEKAPIEFICKSKYEHKRFAICTSEDAKDDIIQGFKITASFQLGSIDPALQSSFGDASYPIEVIVNQSGAYINAQSVPKALYTKLQSAANDYVNALLEPLRVSESSNLVSLSVNPVFESRFNQLNLAFLVSYRIGAGGCVSDNQEVRLEAPFADVDNQVEAVFKNAGKIVEKCIRDGLIQRAMASLRNQEIALFGITAKLDGKPQFNSDLNTAVITITLDDQHSGVKINLKNVTANQRGTSFEIDFRTIDWNYKVPGEDKNVSKKVGDIIEHRIRTIFGGKSDYFTIMNSELAQDGFSFELLVHDLPYIGNYNLGRIYLNALTDRSLMELLKEAVPARLSQAVNHALKENVDIPDLGPIANINPSIRFDGDLLKLNATAELQLYGGVSAPIEIEMFPSQKVHVPNGKQIATTAITSLLTDVIPLKIPPFEFKPAPTQVTYFSNIGAYGVPFGFSVNVSVVKVDVLGIKITPKKLDLPDSISTTLNAPIIIPPYIVIAEPGFTYYLKKQGLTIDGAITIAEQSVAKIVNIDASIGLVDLKALKFELTGKLIAASSLPLFEAKGTIALKEKFVEYEAGTTKLLKPIVEARGQGRLDGKNLKAYNTTELRILGVHISDDKFTLTVPPSKKIEDGTLSYGGSQGMLIGTLSFDLGSDLRLKNPSGKASAVIELGGWKAMSGSLVLDLYRAKLDFKALGIKIKVIAPSVKAITPRVLLRILADLLKVDIKSLLKMKLDEIVVNLMDTNGKVDEQRSKVPECERPGCGPPPPQPNPNPVPPTPPVPVPPPGPCKEDCDEDPISEEEPGVEGYFACYEQIKGRYEFKREYGTQDKGPQGHKHTGALREIRDWHPVTFDKDQAKDLCSGHRLKGAWKPVAARQEIRYRQYQDYACDSDNTLNISISPRDKATWNEYGHGYFCGSVTNDRVAGYKQIREFDGPTISYERWLIVQEGKEEFSQIEHDRLLKELFAQYEGALKEVGTPIPDHTETRLEFEQAEYLCWSCKRRVVIYIYSEPKSALHHWKQAFHLFYNNGEFWYLSMCEDSDLMSQYINTEDPTYKSLCRTTLSKFDTQLDDIGLADLRNEFDQGKVWLDLDEYYFLLEKRAVKHFTGQPMDAKYAESFPINKGGKQYTAQKISSGQGVNQSIEFFIFSKELRTEVHKIVIEPDNPLYKWMDHPYRIEILKMLMDEDVLRVIQDDLASDKLVLIDERSMADRYRKYASTLWFDLTTTGGVEVPRVRDVLMSKKNPYSQHPLQGREYQNVILRYYSEVINNPWTHIDFGVDKKGSYEITVLSGNQSISTLINEKSPSNQVADLAVTRTPTKWINTIISLQKSTCLDAGSRGQLVEIIADPGAYFPSKFDEHPFSKLAQSRCQ